MRKIKGEFLTEQEAESAIEKINPYCSNIKIFYNDMNPNYANYGNYGRLPEDDYLGYPNIGHYNMMANWSLNPFDTFNFEHTRTYNYFSSMTGKSGRTLLEAEVSDDRVEYVKDKLYSQGAISVN